MKIYILLIVLHVALAIMPRCWGCCKEFRRLGNHTENCPQVLARLQGRLQEQMERTARLEAEERERVRRAEEEARRTRERAEQAEAERRARIEVSNDVSFFASISSNARIVKAQRIRETPVAQASVSRAGRTRRVPGSAYEAKRGTHARGKRELPSSEGTPAAYAPLRARLPRQREHSCPPILGTTPSHIVTEESTGPPITDNMSVTAQP